MLYQYIRWHKQIGVEMDRNKSLEFLQDCINKVNIPTDEKVRSLKEKYELNHNDEMINPAFKFIPPYNNQ